MEKIELKDSFRVTDSKVRGYVVIKKDGKTILKKENMIVELGRTYLKKLVSAKLSLTTENRKINEVRFGTGTSFAVPSDEDLEANVSAYDLDLTDIDWRKYTETGVDHGATNPTTVVVGDYFYNTADGELLVGTAGSPNSWVEATNYTTGTSVPFGTGTENHLFYKTDTNTLYKYTKLFVISELTGDEIGLKAQIFLFGRSSDQSISELGLFLDGTGTEMFSRLVFDAIPVTNSNHYEISYYIYF